MTDLPVILETRVRFDETDLHGHVYFGEFFTYLDETFNALLRRIDYRYGRMHEEGWTAYIVHAEMDYRAPAEYEDVIENRMRIESVGEKSLTVRYEARRADGPPLAEGEIVYVTVDYDGDGGAILVPDSFRKAVRDYQEGPSEPG